MVDSETKELSSLSTSLKVSKEISEIAESNCNSVRTKESSLTKVPDDALEAKVEDLKKVANNLLGKKRRISTKSLD